MTQGCKNASPLTPYESWLCAAAAAPSAPSAVFGFPPLRAGSRVRGERFVIGGVLGQGGMGIVYEAYDQERGESVALKTLLDAHPARLLAFKHEFRALCDVRHPNLVALGELFEDGGRWFFTMERIDGVPFTQFVREDGPCFDRLRAALAELAHGLAVLHDLGKVHRDVKPPNVLVEPDGRSVLLDFGLLLDVGSPWHARHVRAGTAAYMAPEQLDGNAGPASDFYSVGVMLYEALSGALPFDGDPESVLAQKAAQEPPPLSRHGSNAPPDLEALCLALLQREPSRRPLAREVLERLCRAVPEVRAPALSASSGGEAREALALLTRAFDAGGRGLLLFGDTGAGKSALLASFARALGDRAAVFAGRCHERERVPFNAVDGVVDALARQLDSLDDVELEGVLPEEASSLERLFPVLAGTARRIGRVPSRALLDDSPHARPRALAALSELFRRIAAERPLAVVIDDIDLADDDSLAFIEAVSRGTEVSRVFWLFAARSGSNLARRHPFSDWPALRLERLGAGQRERRQDP